MSVVFKYKTHLVVVALSASLASQPFAEVSDLSHAARQVRCVDAGLRAAACDPAGCALCVIDQPAVCVR